jgi:hypothetical protein
MTSLSKDNHWILKEMQEIISNNNLSQEHKEVYNNLKTLLKKNE